MTRKPQGNLAERIVARPSSCQYVHRCQRRPFALFVVAALCLTGCDNNPFSQVQVEATLVYEDGSPIPAERIRVWFDSQTPPIDAQTHPRPASAFVNLDDGSLHSFTTYKYGDGLVRGKHKVSIDATPTDLIPGIYRSAATTPLEIDTADSPLKITIPKP